MTYFFLRFLLPSIRVFQRELNTHYHARFVENLKDVALSEVLWEALNQNGPIPELFLFSILTQLALEKCITKPVLKQVLVDQIRLPFGPRRNGDTGQSFLLLTWHQHTMLHGYFVHLEVGMHMLFKEGSYGCGSAEVGAILG